MKILMLLKNGLQLCGLYAVTAILFAPAQAADTPPVPGKKPAFFAPIPAEKPAFLTKIILETGDERFDNAAPQETELDIRAAFVSLFAPAAGEESPEETYNADIKTQTYPHGFKPMTAAQSKLYAQIFEHQAIGQMDKATELKKSLDDYRLMGHILAQRYLHPSYKTSYEELRSWMDHYAELPQAGKIYKLANLRRPKGEAAPAAPKSGKILARVSEPGIQYGKRYRSDANRGARGDQIVTEYKTEIYGHARKGHIDAAITTLRTHQARALMNKAEIDTVQTRLAERLLYAGQIQKAYILARESADRSGYYVPKAHWISGLAMWQQKNFSGAASQFSKISKSPYASGWTASAGAFWAARSHQRTGNKAAATIALKKAAQHPRTFYGIMAVHSLGKSLDFNWETEKYGDAHEETLLAHEAGKRAYALVAAGQYDLAEAELKRLDFKGDKDLQRAALAYSTHVGLPGVALRLGGILRKDNGKYYDSALYPVSPWAPKDGYHVDPALVHAVIRQESRFDLSAVSHSGARGLMQIMPKTAHYVAQKGGYDANFNMLKLKMPETNMKIGQDYLEYLLKSRYVKGDVVSLLIAYNAGPGNLLKWRKRLGNNTDPLLLIEMLPVHETRDYVEKVLSNYWIYRHRAGLDLPSLAAISKGKAPKYAHIMQEDYPYKLAGR